MGSRELRATLAFLGVVVVVVGGFVAGSQYELRCGPPAQVYGIWPVPSSPPSFALLESTCEGPDCEGRRFRLVRRDLDTGERLATRPFDSDAAGWCPVPGGRAWRTDGEAFSLVDLGSLSDVATQESLVARNPALAGGLRPKWRFAPDGALVVGTNQGTFFRLSPATLESEAVPAQEAQRLPTFCPSLGRVESNDLVIGGERHGFSGTGDEAPRSLVLPARASGEASPALGELLRPSFLVAEGLQGSAPGLYLLHQDTLDERGATRSLARTDLAGRLLWDTPLGGARAAGAFAVGADLFVVVELRRDGFEGVRLDTATGAIRRRFRL